MEAVTCNLHSVVPPNPFASNRLISATLFGFNQLHYISSLHRHCRSSCLNMAEPLQIRKSVVQPQKVIITNKYNEKLVGLLHDTGSKEIVVLCHGFQASKEHTIMASLAVALENEGISSFRFDFSGNGESEGLFQYGHYKKEADDLRAVAEHFCAENRIVNAIVGHSKGGDVVLLYASKYHDIDMVVNLSGRYDLNKGIEERLGKAFLHLIQKNGFIDVRNERGTVEYRVTEESLTDRLETNMHEACLLIDPNCRVCTVHGSADETIPVTDALEIAKIIPNHKLYIIGGADHVYTSHQDEVTTAILDFLKGNWQQQKSHP